jgi:hypothetical protein
MWMGLFDKKYQSLKVGENWFDLERIIKEEVDNPESSIMMDHDKAIGHFRAFKRAFEIFLVLFIEFTRERQRRIPCSNHFSKHFDEIRPDFVINYNYTDTFNKLYDNSVYTDYIHGRAELASDVEKCNIVFGINGISNDARKKDYIEFTKSFQCDEKHIIPEYRNWMLNKTINLHIYGHSLDVTDKDSLIEILSYDIKNVCLWSFDEKDFERRKTAIENYITRKRSKPTIEYKQI